MKCWIIIAVIFLWYSNSLKGQESVHKLFPGAYFAIMIDPIYNSVTSDSIQLHSQFLNINCRYALNRVWRVGIEYIYSYTSESEVDDPFSTFGLYIDYDILRADRSKLHLRAGLSISNMLNVTNGLPEKMLTTNRILGGSYEYKLTNLLWVYGGFYHHFPFNKIEFKEAVIQPFIGLCVGI